jgi:hypothetical protein
MIYGVWEAFMRMRLLALGLVVALGVSAAAQQAAKAKDAAKMQEAKAKMPGAAELKKMAARFAPTELKVDLSKLSDGDRKALAKLVQAAWVVDDIFLTQYWNGNHELWTKLKKDNSEVGKARQHYFWINKSPWSALDGHVAFMPGVPEHKPDGANFYPADMTKEDFEKWVKTLDEKQRAQATGFFTVIKRMDAPEIPESLKGRLSSVPYSTEYEERLEKMAKLLEEAAQLTDNATLKRFLTTRAAAFRSNDYYESDVAWMDLDAPLDITIGPYETYNDEIFGYKASYEVYVNLRDDAESKKLEAFSAKLQDTENNLPIDAKYRNPKIGSQAPIRVVNTVYAGGDGNHGVQTAAYNLPNDERVVAEKGSKRVMLKNMQQAKFDKTLVPISRRVLAKDEQKELSFDWFFTHILAHELTHGLGPHQITVEGRKTTPREELKELYSAIEEAKADVTGLFMLQYLMDNDKGGLVQGGAENERKLYTTFLASTFRTLRFGQREAHGKGMAVQVNYFLDKGAVSVRSDGTFAVDVPKMKTAVRDLTRDLLTMEATGDYAGAKEMLDTLGKVRPEFQKALDGLKDIPTDIEPVFVTAKELVGENPLRK